MDPFTGPISGSREANIPTPILERMNFITISILRRQHVVKIIGLKAFGPRVWGLGFKVLACRVCSFWVLLGLRLSCGLCFICWDWGFMLFGYMRLCYFVCVCVRACMCVRVFSVSRL